MAAEEGALGEDFACPVEVEAGQDQASPEGWNWRRIGSSSPTKATYHLAHSDVGRVIVDVLRPSDSPPDTPFVLTADIPILVMDSVDKYWAGESRTQLPLHGVRVPVEGETLVEARQALAADLAAQLRLLLLLSNSRGGKLAPELRENIGYLRSIMSPRTSQGLRQT